MPDDEKPKTTKPGDGLGDTLQGIQTINDFKEDNPVTMQILGAMGINFPDFEKIRDIATEVKKTGNPAGLGVMNEDPSTYVTAETAKEHIKLVSDDFSKQGMSPNAPDNERKEKVSDLDFMGKTRGYGEATMGVKREIMGSPEWGTAGNYQLAGGGAISAGAMLGVPGLALIGLLLHGHGSSMKNNMMAGVDKGVHDLLTDDKDRTGIVGETIRKEFAGIKAEYNALVQNDATPDQLQAYLDQQRSRLMIRHDLSASEVSAEFDIISGSPVPEDPEADAIRKGVKGEQEKAKADVETKITKSRVERGDPERAAIKSLDAGYYDEAVSNYISKAAIPGLATAGITNEEAFNMRWSMDAPEKISRVANTQEETRYYARNEITDPILEKFLGEGFTARDAVRTKGNITNEEVKKVPSLKGVDKHAPIIKQTNQWFFDLVENGEYGPTDDGQVTYYVYPYGRGAPGKRGFKRLFTGGKIDAKAVQLVAKTWPAESEIPKIWPTYPSMDQLYSALDEYGATPEFFRETDVIAEVLR